ncbi:hypothetical protein D932_02048 [Enterococcus casseliflavus 14-MB-W-14]|nr:hypothetical protein D932_02048 [Enterococcus casseliflavus 14-MB-W-14]
MVGLPCLSKSFFRNVRLTGQDRGNDERWLTFSAKRVTLQDKS